MFYDDARMIEIIKCESNFIHYKTDGGVIEGRVTPSDFGISQINRGYHQRDADKLGYDLSDIRGNLAMARTIYDRDGVSAWVCNRHVAKI